MIVAEGTGKPDNWHAYVLLQWGRNLIVAEGTITCRRICGISCFNGAAT